MTRYWLLGDQEIVAELLKPSGAVSGTAVPVSVLPLVQAQQSPAILIDHH